MGAFVDHAAWCCMMLLLFVLRECQGMAHSAPSIGISRLDFYGAEVLDREKSKDWETCPADVRAIGLFNKRKTKEEKEQDVERTKLSKAEAEQEHRGYGRSRLLEGVIYLTKAMPYAVNMNNTQVTSVYNVLSSSYRLMFGVAAAKVEEYQERQDLAGKRRIVGVFSQSARLGALASARWISSLCGDVSFNVLESLSSKGESSQISQDEENDDESESRRKRSVRVVASMAFKVKRDEGDKGPNELYTDSRGSLSRKLYMRYMQLVDDLFLSDNERWAKELGGERAETSEQLDLAMPRNVLLTGAQGGMGLRLTEQLYQLVALQPLVHALARAERARQGRLMQSYVLKRRSAFGLVPAGADSGGGDSGWGALSIGEEEEREGREGREVEDENENNNNFSSSSPASLSPSPNHNPKKRQGAGKRPQLILLTRPHKLSALENRLENALGAIGRQMGKHIGKYLYLTHTPLQGSQGLQGNGQGYGQGNGQRQGQQTQSPASAALADADHPGLWGELASLADVHCIGLDMGTQSYVREKEKEKEKEKEYQEKEKRRREEEIEAERILSPTGADAVEVGGISVAATTVDTRSWDLSSTSAPHLKSSSSQPSASSFDTALIKAYQRLCSPVDTRGRARPSLTHLDMVVHNAGYMPPAARRSKRRYLSPWHLDTYAALIGEKCRKAVSTYTPLVVKVAVSMGQYQAAAKKGPNITDRGDRVGKMERGRTSMGKDKDKVKMKGGKEEEGSEGSVGVIMRKAISDTRDGIALSVRAGIAETGEGLRKFNASNIGGIFPARGLGLGLVILSKQRCVVAGVKVRRGVEVGLKRCRGKADPRAVKEEAIRMARDVVGKSTQFLAYLETRRRQAMQEERQEDIDQLLLQVVEVYQINALSPFAMSLLLLPKLMLSPLEHPVLSFVSSSSHLKPYEVFAAKCAKYANRRHSSGGRVKVSDLGDLDTLRRSSMVARRSAPERGLLVEIRKMLNAKRDQSAWNKNKNQNKINKNEENKDTSSSFSSSSPSLRMDSKGVEEDKNRNRQDMDKDKDNDKDVQSQSPSSGEDIGVVRAVQALTDSQLVPVQSTHNNIDNPDNSDNSDNSANDGFSNINAPHRDTPLPPAPSLLFRPQYTPFSTYGLAKLHLLLAGEAINARFGPGPNGSTDRDRARNRPTDRDRDSSHSNSHSYSHLDVNNVNNVGKRLERKEDGSDRSGGPSDSGDSGSYDGSSGSGSSGSGKYSYWRNRNRKAGAGTGTGTDEESRESRESRETSSGSSGLIVRSIHPGLVDTPMLHGFFSSNSHSPSLERPQNASETRHVHEQQEKGIFSRAAGAVSRTLLRSPSDGAASVVLGLLWPVRTYGPGQGNRGQDQGINIPVPLPSSSSSYNTGTGTDFNSRNGGSDSDSNSDGDGGDMQPSGMRGGLDGLGQAATRMADKVARGLAVRGRALSARGSISGTSDSSDSSDSSYFGFAFPSGRKNTSASKKGEGDMHSDSNNYYHSHNHNHNKDREKEEISEISEMYAARRGRILLLRLRQKFNPLYFVDGRPARLGRVSPLLGQIAGEDQSFTLPQGYLVGGSSDSDSNNEERERERKRNANTLNSELVYHQMIEALSPKLRQYVRAEATRAAYVLKKRSSDMETSNYSSKYSNYNYRRHTDPSLSSSSSGSSSSSSGWASAETYRARSAALLRLARDLDLD